MKKNELIRALKSVSAKKYTEHNKMVCISYWDDTNGLMIRHFKNKTQLLRYIKNLPYEIRGDITHDYVGTNISISFLNERN